MLELRHQIEQGFLLLEEQSSRYQFISSLPQVLEAHSPIATARALFLQDSENRAATQLREEARRRELFVISRIFDAIVFVPLPDLLGSRLEDTTKEVSDYLWQCAGVRIKLSRCSTFTGNETAESLMCASVRDAVENLRRWAESSLMPASPGVKRPSQEMVGDEVSASKASRLTAESQVDLGLLYQSCLRASLNCLPWALLALLPVLGESLKFRVFATSPGPHAYKDALDACDILSIGEVRESDGRLDEGIPLIQLECS